MKYLITLFKKSMLAIMVTMSLLTAVTCPGNFEPLEA